MLLNNVLPQINYNGVTTFRETRITCWDIKLSINVTAGRNRNLDAIQFVLSQFNRMISLQFEVQFYFFVCNV